MPVADVEGHRHEIRPVVPAATVHRDLRRFGGEGVLRGHGREQCRGTVQQPTEFLPDARLTGEGRDYMQSRFMIFSTTSAKSYHRQCYRR